MEYLKLIIDYGIIGFLILLSIVSIAIAIERVGYYKKVDVLKFSSVKELETDLTRGLYIIATIGANAPYIGLLGTVLGIMLTFYTIGQEGLVDIMLVLLTIVLTTATFIVQGSIPVRLPTAKNAEVKNIKSFQINITEKGDVFFEGKKLELSELEEIVKNLDREAQVSIFADKTSKVQTLVSVLDILKKYEIKKVVIKTELIR